MSVLTLSKEDFQRGVLVAQEELGWHPFEVTKHTSKAVKAEKNPTGERMNHFYQLKGLDEATGKKGMFFSWMWSENSPTKFLAPFVAACLPDAKGKSTELNADFFESLVGSKIKAYVKIGPNFTNPDELENQLADFQAL